jgi:hypothetical protein
MISVLVPQLAMASRFAAEALAALAPPALPSGRPLSMKIVQIARAVENVPQTVPPQLYLQALRGRSGDAAMIPRAIALVPVQITANLDKVHEAYFREAVLPRLAAQCADCFGAAAERTKMQRLDEAAELEQTIDFSEPFALTMIEAMAHGNAGACLLTWLRRI